MMQIIKTMKPFCEVIVSDVLPALRAIIANEMAKSYGLSQVQISKKLGVSQPAISQYARELRGRKVKAILSNEETMKLIRKLSHDIALSDIDSKYIHKSLCAICKKIREEGLVCQMHTDMYPSIGPCKICFD